MLAIFRSPDPKVVKNRMHLDLTPDDQEAEVARAIALGARRVDIGQGPNAAQVVMADPEGNEFCSLPSAQAAELHFSPDEQADEADVSGAGEPFELDPGKVSRPAWRVRGERPLAHPARPHYVRCALVRLARRRRQPDRARDPLHPCLSALAHFR